MVGEDMRVYCHVLQNPQYKQRTYIKLDYLTVIIIPLTQIHKAESSLKSYRITSDLRFPVIQNAPHFRKGFLKNKG
jgi:hypothetical protein